MTSLSRCPRCGQPRESYEGSTYCPDCTTFAPTSFEAWMARVDDALVRKVGVSSGDIPDIPYRDLFDQGITPEEAADEAIENAMS